MKERIAYARLTLLNHSQLGIEVSQEVVDLFHRRCVCVAQSQIEHEPRGDAPVILNEPRTRRPVLRADSVADEQKSPRRISGEEVFKWCGIGDLRSLFALEVDPAPACISVEVIDLDAREAAAEFEGVLAPQVREIVLIIVKRVGEAIGTVCRSADVSKRGNTDFRQAARRPHARVEGVSLAIGKNIVVVGELKEVNEVPAKTGFVHHAGIGGPNPVADNRPRAYRN